MIHYQEPIKLWCLVWHKDNNMSHNTGKAIYGIYRSLGHVEKKLSDMFKEYGDHAFFSGIIVTLHTDMYTFNTHKEREFVIPKKPRKWKNFMDNDFPVIMEALPKDGTFLKIGENGKYLALEIIDLDDPEPS